MSNRAIITLISFIFSVNYGFSQCAMCRAVLESSENQSMADGINDGIVYLAFLPYLLVFFLIFIVYKIFRIKN